MERTAVESSNIRAAGYDPGLCVLEIEFTTGALYQYQNVPPAVYQGLVGAESKGQYFAHSIRDRYTADKLERRSEAFVLRHRTIQSRKQKPLPFREKREVVLG